MLVKLKEYEGRKNVKRAKYSDTLKTNRCISVLAFMDQKLLLQILLKQEKII